MSKFKIGDKVRILDVYSILFGKYCFDNGDITEVIDITDDAILVRDIKKGGEPLIIYPDELHAIELVETPDEIEELKRKVSELEAKVKRLESENFTVSPSIIAKPSPNDERKQVIEKAKKFVAKIQSESDNGRNKEGGNRTYRLLATKSEFIVNEKKRTIVALVRGVGSGTLLEKGIAKCAPTDVFNEHIGKAIALGRAYGLDVSEFEHAPHPDEVVVGMKVKVIGLTFPYEAVVTNAYDRIHNVDNLRNNRDRIIRIISDTGAKY